MIEFLIILFAMSWFVGVIICTLYLLFICIAVILAFITKLKRKGRD